MNLLLGGLLQKCLRSDIFTMEFIGNIKACMIQGYVHGSTHVGQLHMLTNLTLQYEGRPDQMEAMLTRLDTAGATHLVSVVVNRWNTEVAAEAVQFGMVVLFGGSLEGAGLPVEDLRVVHQELPRPRPSKMQRTPDV